jgi:hypothetical protein
VYEWHTALSEFLSSEAYGVVSCPCFVDDLVTQEAYRVYMESGHQAASEHIKHHFQMKDDKQNPIETVRVVTLAQAQEAVQWDWNQPLNEELLDPLMKQWQHMCTYNDRDTAGFNKKRGKALVLNPAVSRSLYVHMCCHCFISGSSSSSFNG